MAKYTWFQELFAPEIEAAERKAVMEAKKEVAEEVTRVKDIESARTAFAANLDFELARKLAPYVDGGGTSPDTERGRK